MLWLSGGFHHVSEYLGTNWILQAHAALLGDRVRSLSDAAHVALTGWMLHRTRNMKGADSLYRIIRRNPYSRRNGLPFSLDEIPPAITELQAICLVDTAAPGAAVEYEPTSPDPADLSVPDAKFVWDNGAVLYLEVSRRQQGSRKERQRQLIDAVLARCSHLVPSGLSTQLALSPDASESCIDDIVRVMSDTVAWCSPTISLPNGAGHLRSASCVDGRSQVVGTSDGVETPGVEIWTPLDSNGPGRLVVSMETTDDEIEAKVRKEATQLPHAYPGIVLIHCCTATRMSATWINRLRKDFESGLRTRPSGAWSFFCDDWREPLGSSNPFLIVGRVNPHAKQACPPSVAAGLLAMADPDAERWAARFPNEL